MDCDLRDHVQQQIYFFGGYEPIEASLLLSLLGEGDVVVDAGANVGFYTLIHSAEDFRGQLRQLGVFVGRHVTAYFHLANPLGDFLFLLFSL